MTPGVKVADRFRLVRQVGEGGMGAVHLAVDEHSGAQVALKTLTLRGDAARARFEREALTLASLEHPNIVGYVAHGLPLDAPPWLAMEWVVGVAPDDATLSLADSLCVLRGAARGLAAAHGPRPRPDPRNRVRRSVRRQRARSRPAQRRRPHEPA